MIVIRPKKRLGQHFLKDRNIARKIVDTLSPAVPDVVEIGPGTGILTGFLLQRTQQFRRLKRLSPLRLTELRSCAR